MLVEQRVGDFIGEPCEGARYKFKQIESVWDCLPSNLVIKYLQSK